MRPTPAILLTLALAAAAVAQTSQPAAPDIASRVAQLDDRDPEIRLAAREALMSLKRDDLPRLRDAVAGSAPGAVRRDALRDVVVHVYLTGKHNFRGAAGGYIGIIGVPAAGEPPMVASRMVGYDAYRALRDGDVIVGLRVPPRRGEGEGSFVAVRSLVTLRELLAGATVGQWVGVRVLRDGAAEPIETRLRIGPQAPALIDSKGVNPFLPEAEAYWSREFAPALTTTRPADSPS